MLMIIYRKKETYPNFCQSSPKSGESLGSIFPSSNCRPIPASQAWYTGTRKRHRLSSYLLYEGRFPTDEQCYTTGRIPAGCLDWHDA